MLNYVEIMIRKINLLYNIHAPKTLYWVNDEGLRHRVDGPACCYGGHQRDRFFYDGIEYTESSYYSLNRISK